MTTVPNPVQLPARYGKTLVHIGSGGFGAVYRTDDEVLGIPVAVKVPTGAESRRQARAVLLELRAAAALRHEGFVQVLDADLDPHGVPYLVMEYADGGVLQDKAFNEPVPWSVVAPWIRQLFEGLAYAHAEGLVHRDVKLDNVLLATDPEGGLRAMLADFGLTKVESDGDFASTRLLAGTLLYMAPEAFEDDAALIHPGVDLYAMGVLVYVLLAGRTPWKAQDLALIAAKIDGRHLRMKQGEGIPQNVADVVNRLLEPDARARYPLAADVIADLFPSEGDEPALSRSVPIPVDGDSAFSSHPALDSPLPRQVSRSTHVLSPLRQPPPALAIVREPLLVGRLDERDRIWERARLATAGPVGVVVSGAAGSGRSRLCHWLASTLEQGGHARTLHVRFGATTAPSEAVANALRRFLILGRANGEELRRRVKSWFRGHGEDRPEDVEALLLWLDAGATPGRSVVDAREAAARRRALLELVLRLESRRGLVCVWFEETGGSTSGAPLAAELLRSAGANPFPLLVLYDRDEAGELSSALQDWTNIELDRLGDEEVQALLLDLAIPADMVGVVGRRTGGNPARAVEAARLHCSGLGALAGLSASQTSSMTGPHDDAPIERPTPSPDAGYEDTVEVDPAELALVRLRGFCDGDGTGEALGLVARGRLVKLMALLPRPCADERLVRLWPTGADDDALAIAIEDAAVAGVVQRDQEGDLDFTGGPIGAAAIDYTNDAQDAATLRKACAKELASDAAPPGALWAAARLLDDAGEPSQALDLLIRAAERLALQDIESGERAWEDAVAMADKAGLAPTDPRRVQTLLGAAQAARDVGNIDRAEEHLGGLDVSTLDVSAVASRHEVRASIFALRTDLPASRAEAEQAVLSYEEAGDEVGEARARLFVGDVLARLGKRDEAVAIFTQTRADAERAGEERTALWARWLRARCLRALGRKAEAKAELEGVLEHAARIGVAAVQGGALRELGNIALRNGAHDEAEQLLRRAATRLEGAGLKVEAAVTRVSLGELARARGDLAGARSEYSSTFSVMRAYGLTSEVLVTLINLGIVELAMGRARRAARRLDEIDRLLPREQPHGLRRYVEALRVACLAEKEAWEEAEESVDGLAEGGALPADPDLLWLLEHAGGCARVAGEASLAADAMDLALGIAESLGDTTSQQRLRTAMQGG